MTEQQSEQSGGPSPLPQPPPLQLTFQPLCLEPGDALDPQGSPRIKAVGVHKVQYVLPNAFHQVITKEGDDLLSPNPTGHDRPALIPANGTHVLIILGFYIAGLLEPEEVELRPPNTVKIRTTTYASVILDWLAQSTFNTAHHLTKLGIILLLALAAAAAFDDSVTDNDDDDDERTKVSSSSSFSFS